MEKSKGEFAHRPGSLRFTIERRKGLRKRIGSAAISAPPRTGWADPSQTPAGDTSAQSPSRYVVSGLVGSGLISTPFLFTATHSVHAPATKWLASEFTANEDAGD
jgi:hypothetical protein